MDGVLNFYSVGTLEKLEESLRLMEHTLPTFFSGVLGIYKEDGKFHCPHTIWIAGFATLNSKFAWNSNHLMFAGPVIFMQKFCTEIGKMYF